LYRDSIAFICTLVEFGRGVGLSMDIRVFYSLDCL
jgi:hypothetical protein